MPQISTSRSQFVYIGCYTRGAGGAGEGIVLACRDPASGALSRAVTAALTPAPSFLARHPRLGVLYAVNELADGAVSAFAVARDGALTPLGVWPTGGRLPCHLSATPTWLAVANYGSGSAAVLPLDSRGVPDGRLDVTVHTGTGPDRERQAGPHAHMVVPTVDGVVAVDLGADAVFRHGYDDAAGRWGRTATLAGLPAGTGPRHLVADPSGRVHVVGELDATVTTYEIGGGGAWREVGRARTTAAASAQPSEIDISADGRFLYVGNRGPDTVAVLATGGSTVALVGEVRAGGAWPRHLVVVGTHLYVANERSDRVALFTLDPATGLPSAADGGVDTPSPTCVLPAGTGWPPG